MSRPHPDTRNRVTNQSDATSLCVQWINTHKEWKTRRPRASISGASTWRPCLSFQLRQLFNKSLLCREVIHRQFEQAGGDDEGEKEAVPYCVRRYLERRRFQRERNIIFQARLNGHSSNENSIETGFRRQTHRAGSYQNEQDGCCRRFPLAQRLDRVATRRDGTGDSTEPQDIILQSATVTH